MSDTQTPDEGIAAGQLRPGPPTPIQLDSLTGLRACAALLVFAGHAIRDTPLDFMFKQSAIAVSFFFVLSGFVLIWVGDERLQAARFYQRRFARLYPAYAVAWIGGIALSLSLGLHEGLWKAVSGAALLQSWVPSMGWYYSYNSVAWSLSCEAFFYLSFPLWAPMLARATSRTRLLVGAAAFAAIVLVALVGELRYPMSAVVDWPDDSNVEWFVRLFPPVRALEFVLGAVLALEMRDGRRFPLRLGPALVIAAAVYLVTPQIVGRWQEVALPLLPLVAIVGAAAQADLDGRTTWLSTRPMVWAGGISYSFYLAHQLVIRTFEAAFDLPVSVLVLPMLIVSVVVAALMVRWVERPWNRWLRGPAKGQSLRPNASVPVG